MILVVLMPFNDKWHGNLNTYLACSGLE